MKHLFVRLVGSGAIVASLGAGSALADSSTIGTTGPCSTNTVSNNNGSWWSNNTHNLVGLGNWNSQSARTGEVRVNHNTFVDGLSGSGAAFNSNSGHNSVNIANGGGMSFGGFGYGSGSGSDNGASIWLTGPDSVNRITTTNSNEFTQNTTNNVNAQNYNNQSAQSGSTSVHGNTLVLGGASSGDAANSNSAANNVNIANTSGANAGASTGTGSSDSSNGSNASIGVTGPGSTNVIKTTNQARTNITTNNRVDGINASQQTARSGGVGISGNTVVTGGASSGNAYNQNAGQNSVSISN